MFDEATTQNIFHVSINKISVQHDKKKKLILIV